MAEPANSPYHLPNGQIIPSPESTTTTNTTFSTNSSIQIMDDDIQIRNNEILKNNHNNHNSHNNNNGANNSSNNNDYAEITTFDRTMKESALQQIQREIEEQLNRLKNLNNKEFLAEMEVIKKNLNLTDDQMVNLTLMTLREVPIKHRNCQCCYIHIKQKYNNCLFTTPMSQNTTSSNNIISGYHNGNDPDSTYDQTYDDDNINSRNDELLSETPPTPQTPQDLKYNQFGFGSNNNNNNKRTNLDSLRSIFNNIMDTPQTADKQATDIDSILESEEMEYKLPPRIPSNSNIIDANNYIENGGYTTTTNTANSAGSTHSGSGSNYYQDRMQDISTKLYVDTTRTQQDKNNYGLCLQIGHRIRAIFFFLIPFIYTFISALVALIILMEVFTESYIDNNDQCQICHTIHDIFYGPKVHKILTDGSSEAQLIAFYLILILRITTILIWYILMIHTLLFQIISCCCCCQIEIECDYLNDCCCCLSSSASKLSLMGQNRYQLMNNTPNMMRRRSKRNKNKYGTSGTSTILLNSTVSIDEHLRSKSRTITPTNILKFYLRMVLIPNVIAIILHIILFDEPDQFFMNIKTFGIDGDDWNHNEHLNLYINFGVLFGFYWSLSDWFYFDRDNILCKWNDVYYVFLIDLTTNWIKFIYEIFNFIIFLILCILIFLPLTIFVILRILICPCFFGYNNSGCLFCNLYENLIEFLLKIIKKCYI